MLWKLRLLRKIRLEIRLKKTWIEQTKNILLDIERLKDSILIKAPGENLEDSEIILKKIISQLRRNLRKFNKEIERLEEERRPYED